MQDHCNLHVLWLTAAAVQLPAGSCAWCSGQFRPIIGISRSWSRSVDAAQSSSVSSYNGIISGHGFVRLLLPANAAFVHIAPVNVKRVCLASLQQCHKQNMV
jgi:hypothetical protein